MGFSLFELLIALTISVVLSLIAVSGWQHFNHNEHIEIRIQELAATLNFARMEAVRAGELVIFCKSSDHRHCGGHWRDGQLLISASGKILRTLEALPNGDDLIWRASFGRDDAIEFLPTGYVNQQGSFYYYLANPQLKLAVTHKLVVNQTGRVRIERVN